MMIENHCKICMVQDYCDVPGCGLAYLADRRDPVTEEERSVQEAIRKGIANIAESSNGKTPASGAGYRGSSPCSAVRWLLKP